MHGIHDVWDPDEDEDKDTISVRKVKKGEGHWELEKELLGFDFDGTNHTIWLAAKKCAALVTILKGWIRGATHGRGASRSRSSGR
ncbi:hypothetical protein ACHAWF_008225 [Thalassiosira exigua]